MTYILELKPEVARAIEAEAAQQKIAPEEVATQMLETAAAQHRRAQVREMAEKLFDDRAPVYEALAEGAK